jgi:hypothetical protein
MVMRHAAFTVAAALSLAVPLAAQTAPPAPITGFRSAQFRMTPQDVRRAIAADFPGAQVVERTQPDEGTTMLQLVVDPLDPGPGAATISYVFGASSRTLAQISVIWATSPDPTPAERQAIAVAALRLSSYFRTMSQAGTVVPPTILRAGAVSLYGVVDAKGAGIELVASGIFYRSAHTQATPPTGPASLRLSYMANPANPDVRQTHTAVD